MLRKKNLGSYKEVGHNGNVVYMLRNKKLGSYKEVGHNVNVIYMFRKKKLMTFISGILLILGGENNTQFLMKNDSKRYIKGIPSPTFIYKKQGFFNSFF